MQKVMDRHDITVIVNTAEDIWISGNHISPDVDTVMYLFALPFATAVDDVGCRAAPRPAPRCRRATARVTSKTPHCIARFVITARPSRPPSQLEAR
jgi:hypothetical protein